LRPLTVLLGNNSSGKSSLGHSLLLMRQTVCVASHTLTLRGDQGAYTIDLGEFEDVLHKSSGEQQHFALGFDFVDRETGTIKFDANYQQDSAQTISLLCTVPGDFKSRVCEQLDKIHYLGPWRQRSLREYPAGDPALTVPGIEGQGFAELLIRAALSTKAEHRVLLEGVEHWLQRLQLAQGLDIQPAAANRSYQLRLKREGRLTNLADAGIGVAYILPLLVMAYAVAAGSTVIVEEPEIHLHPLAQAVLADLFVEINKQRQVQFIVETHSEHLFRRLQTLISRQQLNTSELAIYHVEQRQGSARLKELQLDEFGRVHNWPATLFGDALGETREQARRMFERQQERLR
jgi:predicted ATPase